MYILTRGMSVKEQKGSTGQNDCFKTFIFEY